MWRFVAVLLGLMGTVALNTGALAATDMSCTPAAIERVALGDRSDAVTNLQACLKSMGYKINVDGLYGLRTQRVVDSFYASELPGAPHGAYLGPLGRERLKVILEATTDVRTTYMAAPNAGAPAQERPRTVDAARAAPVPDRTVVPTSPQIQRAAPKPAAPVVSEHVSPALPTQEYAAPVPEAIDEPTAAVPDERAQDAPSSDTTMLGAPEIEPDGVPADAQVPSTLTNSNSADDNYGCDVGDGACVAGRLTVIYTERRQASEQSARNNRAEPLENASGTDPPSCDPDVLYERDRDKLFVDITGCPDLHRKLVSEATVALYARPAQKLTAENYRRATESVFSDTHHS